MKIIEISWIAAIAAIASCAMPKQAGNDMPPKDIRACYYSSYRYEKTQNYEDAVKALLILHQTYPKGYTVNLRLGWLYYLRGNYANSEKHYQTAIKAAPSSIEAKLGYTLPLLAQERYEDVETITKQILAADYGNYYGNLRFAFALRMQKKYEQVEKVVTRMLVFYPTDVSFLIELGLLRVAQGQTEAAKRLFYDVLTLDPENVTAKQQLGNGK